MLRGRMRFVVPAALLVVAARAVAYAASRPAPPPPRPDPPRAATPTATPTATPAPHRRKPRPPKVDRFVWATYGYSKDPRRVFLPRKRMSGPGRRVWFRPAHALLEFPPVIARGLLVQLADDGTVRALDKDTGKLRWRRRIGSLSASTPAVSRGRLFATLLEGPRHSGRGRVVALRLRDGKRLWTR